MKVDVIKLDGKKAGSVDLDEALFGLEPRADILHRVVPCTVWSAGSATTRSKAPTR